MVLIKNIVKENYQKETGFTRLMNEVNNDSDIMYILKKTQAMNE